MTETPPVYPTAHMLDQRVTVSGAHDHVPWVIPGTVVAVSLHSVFVEYAPPGEFGAVTGWFSYKASGGKRRGDNAGVPHTWRPVAEIPNEA